MTTPSTQHGGGLVVSNTQELAYLLEYQTVTSHGHEAVSDKAPEADIAHSPGVAIITPHNWNTNKPITREGRVHVPLHNPPGITTRWLLDALDVNFDSEHDGSVERISIYYDGALVFTTSTKSTSRFYIDFNTTEAGDYGYVRPKGISITLDLGFPKAHSLIKLHSLTLAYRAVPI